MRCQLFIGYFFLLTLLPLSCNRDGGSDAGKPVIAVIPKGTAHEFWKSIHAGAVKAARELDVEIIWKGPLKEDDREAQIRVVEDFITRGVDGIVLAPLDETALRQPVSNAARSGIPVIIIDSGLRGDEHLSFIATDNRHGGRLAGRHIGELLVGKGRVIMLRYQEGSASTANREAGFLEAIAAFPEIAVISSNQYGGATTESAYRAAENLLAPYRDAGAGISVDAIFTPNESTTFGMLRALQDAGLAGKIRFVGFDSSRKLVTAVREGHLDGLVLQNPFRMGYLGVTAMVDHLRGGKLEKRVDTGVVLATRENMDDPEIRNLLLPDLSRWLNEND